MSLLRLFDRIVLGIKNEQTTKKLLRMRDLTLNRCIDVCRSEEVAELQMKSLSGPVDNINQVKSSSKKPRAPTPVDGRSAKKISCKFCGYDHQPDRKMCPAWGKKCKRCKEKNHFAKKCKKVPVHNIESEEELEEISVVRVQALRGRAVYARMLVREQPVQFQVDCAASANILPLKYAEGEEFDSCSQMLVMWNGTKVTPVGSCVLPVVNSKTNEKYKVRFLVVKEDLTPLLGLNATEKMKLLTVHKKNFIKEAVSRQSSSFCLILPVTRPQSLWNLLRFSQTCELKFKSRLHNCVFRYRQS